MIGARAEERKIGRVQLREPHAAIASVADQRIEHPHELMVAAGFVPKLVSIGGVRRPRSLVSHMFSGSSPHKPRASVRTDGWVRESAGRVSAACKSVASEPIRSFVGDTAGCTNTRSGAASTAKKRRF